MYVLHTGASWKGSIGRARVVCDLSGLGNLSVTLRPKPTYRTRTTAVWELSNLKPTDKDDVIVHWLNGFTDIVVDGVNPFAVLDTDESDEGLPWDPDLEDPPVRENREVWVPVRALGAWCLATVIPSGDMQTVRVVRGGRSIEFRLGSAIAKTDHGKVRLSHAVRRTRGATYVPFMVAVKALGGTAAWDKNGVILRVSSLSR